MSKKNFPLPNFAVQYISQICRVKLRAKMLINPHPKCFILVTTEGVVHDGRGFVPAVIASAAAPCPGNIYFSYILSAFLKQDYTTSI